MPKVPNLPKVPRVPGVPRVTTRPSQTCQPTNWFVFTRDLFAGPSNPGKFPDPGRGYRQPLRRQQGPLQRRVGVAAEFASSRDHTVVRQTRPRRLLHDVADRPCRPWPSGEPRDVTVRSDAAGRNPRHHAQHSSLEWCHRPMVILRRSAVPPRFVSLNAAETPASPIASGTVDHAASPAMPSHRVILYAAPP